MDFKRISPEEIKESIFDLIGNQWMLVTASNGEKFNMMTASWGGMGVLWNKRVATIYVRPQRYTYQFVEKSDSFTLSFFDRSFKPQLALCGAKSGRDVDKVRETGLTPVNGPDGTVYFKEAKLVLICKKLYFNDIDPANFLSDDIAPNYTNNDYHRMYIGEIVETLSR